MPGPRVYLDHNATTPVREEVVEATLRVLRDCYANPSSTHADGAAARAEVERARERVASLVGARPEEVVFTAGATEANNTALHGVLALAREADPARRRLVITTVEHPSVVEPAAVLEAAGAEVVRVPVDADGLVDREAFAAALGPETALVSVIWANNETGVLQPVEALAEEARACGARVHFDATQAVGKIPVDLRRVPADLIAGSAHKLNGPKGVGFLIEAGGLTLPAFVRGGPQERRRRGGTENLPGIVGLGVACELAERELEARGAEYARLRDRLWEGLCAKVPRLRRNGSEAHVLPNTLNVEFEDTPGEILLQALDLEGVAVSAGAACASGSIEPSHVLASMGRSPAQARGSLRLSVGHGTTEGDVDRVLALLPDLVERVRASGAA